MPDDSTKLLTDAGSSIASASKAIATLAPSAPAPVVVAGFVAESVFKAIQLGLDIFHAQSAASDKLEKAVRLRDIFRPPIDVDLQDLQFRDFFNDRRNFSTLPDLAQQFAPEIQAFRDTDGDPPADVANRLRAAMQLAPVLRDDPFLDANPGLQRLFGIGANPVRLNLAALVREFLFLYPDAVLPYRQHYERLADFWKDKLTFELGEIDRLQLEQQQALGQQIKGLIEKAVFSGDDSLTQRSIQFAKGLKKTAIDADIARLTKAKDLAATQPDKDAIQAQIDKLTTWKGKL